MSFNLLLLLSVLKVSLKKKNPRQSQYLVHYACNMQLNIKYIEYYIEFSAKRFLSKKKILKSFRVHTSEATRNSCINIDFTQKKKLSLLNIYVVVVVVFSVISLMINKPNV